MQVPFPQCSDIIKAEGIAINNVVNVNTDPKNGFIPDIHVVTPNYCR
jgi:DNA-binding protein